MKKFVVLMLALVLSGSAMAGVDVNCSSDGLQVTIHYEASDDANRPRAFGLDITVDNDATIESIDSDNADYWVHPTNIVITDGNVTTEGNAAADPCDAPSDTKLGIDTNGLTIEMGSLYDSNDPCHPNPPALDGALITITVSGDCNVTIAGNAARGNVVLESAVEASVVYTGCQVSSECWTGDTASYNEWASVGKPDCWCAASPTAVVQGRQCHGDADGRTQGKPKYGVGTDDLNVFLDAFNKDYATIAGQVYNHLGGYTTPLICADFDHLSQGKPKYRAGTNDLNILLKWFNVGGNPDPNCQDILGNQDKLPQP